MALYNEFLKFLESDEVIFRTEINKKVYDIFKLKYSEDIDMLYISSNYYNKTGMGDKFEYTGFYDNRNNKLYDIGYYLKKDVLGLEFYDNKFVSAITLQSEISEKVNEIIFNEVMNNKESFYNAAKDYESYITENNILEYIVNDKEIPRFISYSSYYVGATDNDKILNYIEKGDSYLNEIVSEIMSDNKEEIGKRLINYEKENELYNEVLSNENHFIHKRKEIIKSIEKSKCSNINISIFKNGKYFDFKYSSNKMKNRVSGNWLSVYDIPSSSRKNYMKLFGNKDFFFEDIYKLKYRNEEIYEDKNFEFNKEQDVNYEA